MELKLCAACGKKKTARLMKIEGEKLPVCTDCLTFGRWRELLPAPVEPEPEPGPTPASAPAPAPEPETPESTQDVVNDLACTICGRPCKSTSGLKSHMRIHK